LIEQWHRERRDREELPLTDSEDLIQLRIEENQETEDQKDTGTMPGSSGSAGPPAPTNDGNQLLLQQFQAMIEAQMAALRLELGTKKPDDQDAEDRPCGRETESTGQNGAIDAESEMIQKGQWTGPVAPLSPTSIYIAPMPAIAQPSPQKAPQPRFNPNGLPQLRFGEDLEE
jgi:hypothetical protein